MYKNKPLFSIITPSYNMDKFLEGCIKSVLNQDYPNIEHIIHDGNSSDKTYQILSKYSKPKFKNRINISISHDLGQADGLNKAILKAKGDYILVLNADDELLPYACSWAYTNFSLFPNNAVIYGDVFLINEKGEIVKIAQSNIFDKIKLFCVELVPPAQAAFIKTSYFKKVGYFADKTLDTCPDFEMWVRIAAKYQMKYIPGIVSKYRVYPHKDSHSPRSALRFFHAKKSVIDKALNKYASFKKIPNLKNKAYSGLCAWTAHQAIYENNFLTIKMIFLSLIYHPSKNNIKRFINIFIDSPLLLFRIIFKK